MRRLARGRKRTDGAQKKAQILGDGRVRPAMLTGSIDTRFLKDLHFQFRVGST